MKKVIIIWGAPSSGKGTQATLLAGRFGFYHFDTGGWLRKILFDSDKKTKEIIQRQNEYKKGELIDPKWFLKGISKEIKKLADLEESIIFSGSPRTYFEAFGDKTNKGIFQILEKLYGKKNIKIFNIIVPEQASLNRGSSRLVCSVCKSPLLSSKIKFKICPFCGAKLIKRLDDKKEIIKNRLKEYSERTEPVIKEAVKRGYKVNKIQGTALPYQIHEKIVKYF